MRTKPIVVRATIVWTVALLATIPARGAAEPPDGQVIVPTPEAADDISDDQRREIWERLLANVAALKEAGVLTQPPPAYFATHATYDWPLRSPALSDADSHFMWSYVDHNPNFPNALLDYNCGTRTYDRADGYNHQGSDFGVWPFPWLRKEEGQFEIVAAAAGTLIGKDDGYPDSECANPSLPWNAVYIQHPDGSYAWYGHMRLGSPTAKPVGSAIAKGEYLGLLGSSGNSRGPHLHLEVYDSAGALNDPYQGACNNFNATGWWAAQRPYPDPSLNHIGVGFAFPQLPDCTREDPKEAADFNPGDRIFFTAYYRDQPTGPSATNTVRRPDGTVYATWTDNPVAFQVETYWERTIINFSPTGPVGIWRYDVTYQGKTSSKNFRLSAASGSGRVPGALPDEVPVRVTKAGANLSLTWAATCVQTDNDYEVYEGTLGSWTSHTSKLCTTGGATAASFAAPAGSTYYVIVPTDGSHEGSYGWNHLGVERPAGVSSCHAQVIGGNCPRCGDVVLETPEVCDRAQLNGHTCQTEGFADGELTCNATCDGFDTSGCF